MATRAFEAGRMVYVELMELTFGRARIIETDGELVFQFWWFASEAVAVAALQRWIDTGASEPDCWIRASPLPGSGSYENRYHSKMVLERGPVRRSYPWTLEEDHHLIASYHSGVSLRVVAEQVSRSHSAVRNRLLVLRRGGLVGYRQLLTPP